MTDVCLILEGTFPYVAGGVSTWVYELIKNLDDLTFSILYLGAHQVSSKRMHYDLPSNVLDFKEHYIFDYRLKKTNKCTANKKDYELIGEFLRSVKQGDASLFKDVYSLIGDEKTRKLDVYDIIHSKEAWDMLLSVYSDDDKESSFIDYFWSWRFIYLPFFSLLRVPLASARMYHTVSTGYAGVLGSLCKMKFNRPLLLTEHGIYTRERKIEIAQADWIYSETAQEITVNEEKEFFKEWWISLFSLFSLIAYEQADEIITLYEGNRRIQLEEGASAEKTKIIPNGIDFRAFDKLEKESREGVFRVGFMGRVVPIKDVKTFIRACKIIHDEIGNVEFYIMGPTDEDEEYFKECVALVKMESLLNVVNFTGKINVKEYYPKIDVIVLTSISEAQPIVVLEALACGIPSVSTDVGCCRELFFGRTSADKLLGQCGIITPIYNAQETAEAVIKLLRDPALYKKMSVIGKERVKQYYEKDDVWANYYQMYNQYTEEVRWQA